jgi:cell division protein FtsL
MSVVIEARNRGGVSFSVIFLEVLPAAFAVSLLALVGMVHVASRVAVVSTGYELSRLDAQSTELLRENAALKLELATQKSPVRLEALARAKLAMAPPPVGSVVVVKP